MVNAQLAGIPKTKSHVLEVLDLWGEDMKTYSEQSLTEAIKKVAERYNLNQSTITAQCTREMGGIGIDAFRLQAINLLFKCERSDHLYKHLTDGEDPNVKGQIDQALAEIAVTSQMNIV